MGSFDGPRLRRKLARPLLWLSPVAFLLVSLKHPASILGLELIAKPGGLGPELIAVVCILLLALVLTGTLAHVGRWSVYVAGAAISAWCLLVSSIVLSACSCVVTAPAPDSIVPREFVAGLYGVVLATAMSLLCGIAWMLSYKSAG